MEKSSTEKTIYFIRIKEALWLLIKSITVFGHKINVNKYLNNNKYKKNIN